MVLPVPSHHNLSNPDAALKDHLFGEGESAAFESLGIPMNPDHDPIDFLTPSRLYISTDSPSRALSLSRAASPDYTLDPLLNQGYVSTGSLTPSHPFGPPEALSNQQYMLLDSSNLISLKHRLWPARPQYRALPRPSQRLSRPIRHQPVVIVAAPFPDPR
jgi:hypothetical protein